MQKFNRILGYDFLKNRWKSNRGFRCLISNSASLVPSQLSPKEIFSPMVILELLMNCELDQSTKHGIIDLIKKCYNNENLFSFFEKEPIAADIDVTALGVLHLTLMHQIDPKRAQCSVNKIISNTTQEGLIHTWFSESIHYDKYIDAVAMANALYLIHLYQKEDEAKKSENFLLQLLYEDDEHILKMSPYYLSPDAFLYQISRLVTTFSILRKKFAEPLKNKLQKRIGSSDSLLDLSMRAIVAEAVGVDNTPEKEKIAAVQSPEGWWPEAAFFCTGTYKQNGPTLVYFGSKELSTAFCLRALKS